MSRTPHIERQGDLILKPFKEFAKLESSGGLVLIVATIIALVWANSPWSHQYFELWEKKFTIGIGDMALSKSLHHWINDGLMAIFFFVVGLEIKREVLVGELATLRKSIMPIAAAIGGMVVPAGLFWMINAGSESISGWGIPMATDIAFAIGILTLLGNRVPISLKIFLTALAIIDDLGAVLVIAFFYTSEIAWSYLGWAAVLMVMLFIINRLDLRHPLIYIVPGLVLWFFMLKSGIHATIAGVFLAMTVPARALIDSRAYLKHSRKLFKELEDLGVSENPQFTPESHLDIIHSIKELSEHLETPLQRMEHALHSWTTYLIIPVFALANAGVALNFEMSAISHNVTLGIFMGLVMGKQLGVFFFSWVSVKLGWAVKPEGTTWGQIYGIGLLAGVGFTMSLFIGNLAYTNDEFMQMAKLGILSASLVAGVVGWFVVYTQTKDLDPQPN